MHAVACRDVRLLLDAVATLHEGPDGGGFVQRARRAVASLMPLASVTFDVFRLTPSRSVALMPPTGDGRPFDFSDTRSRHQLLQLASYRALISPMGVDERTMMILRMDATTVGLVCKRDRIAFTARDRTLLHLLQPHIATVYQRDRVRIEEASEPTAESLTPREREVLHWVARGQTNEQIGRTLRISARTVQVHLAHACRKLGTRSRTGAVVALLGDRSATTAHDYAPAASIDR